MGIEKSQGILTEQQFNTSPLKGKISYADYVQKALKLGSAFTIARLMQLQKAEDVSEDIKNGVKGWAIEKQQAEDAAEEAYYAALAQEHALKKAEEKALREVEYERSSFGEESFRYNEAQKKFNNTQKEYNYSSIDREIAAERWNSASKAALNAFYTSRTLD